MRIISCLKSWISSCILTYRGLVAPDDVQPELRLERLRLSGKSRFSGSSRLSSQSQLRNLNYVSLHGCRRSAAPQLVMWCYGAFSILSSLGPKRLRCSENGFERHNDLRGISTSTTWSNTIRGPPEIGPCSLDRNQFVSSNLRMLLFKLLQVACRQG